MVMPYILFITIGRIHILILPCLIVAIWRARPRLAMLIASLILSALVIIPPVIRTYQAMVILGRDGQAMTTGMIDAFLHSVFSLLFFLPALFLFRWIIRKIFPNRRETREVFD